MQLSTVDSVAARQSWIPVWLDMFFSSWTLVPSRLEPVELRVRVSLYATERFAALRKPPSASIFMLSALQTVSQSMRLSVPNRCAKDRNCVRSFVSLPLLRGLDFSPLFAPHVYTDLGAIGPCSVATMELPEVFKGGLRGGSIPAPRRNFAASLCINRVLLPLSPCSRGRMWASVYFLVRVGTKVCIWTGP